MLAAALLAGCASQPAAPDPLAASAASMEFPVGFVPAPEAINHLGEVATVCGKVASAKYATTSTGAPTFLNLDKPYPKPVLTILIWPEHRASFGGAPEQRFAGTRVCITGLVESYNGVPQIESSGADIQIYE